MVDTKQQDNSKQSLYERLGGIYAIAAVVNRFSDRLFDNPKIVNSSPELKEWHTQKYKQRLPGLKFMRTLWVAAVTGGPFTYTGKTLDNAHFDLHVPPEVFDEVSNELRKTLDDFGVPEQEKKELMFGFDSQKPDVIKGAR